MGGVARILSFVRRVRRGANVSDAKVDTGGGPNVTAENFSTPGDDSHPLPGDFVLLVQVQQTGRSAAAGYLDPLNEQTAGPGERRLYARDSDGAIVSTIWLKSDGSVLAQNAGGYFELQAGGAFIANGATATTDGDVVTSDGVSLRDHTHIGNFGSPTSKPII